jgi:hypothetical protein
MRQASEFQRGPPQQFAAPTISALWRALGVSSPVQNPCNSSGAELKKRCQRIAFHFWDTRHDSQPLLAVAASSAPGFAPYKRDRASDRFSEVINFAEPLPREWVRRPLNSDATLSDAKMFNSSGIDEDFDDFRGIAPKSIEQQAHERDVFGVRCIRILSGATLRGHGHYADVILSRNREDSLNLDPLVIADRHKRKLWPFAHARVPLRLAC